MVNVEKVGKVILHILDIPLEKDTSDLVGLKVTCKLDVERREQLRNHHTGTHVMFAACKQVLGPHVWQHGAKKTIHQAHLDITHFSSITKEQETEIQNTANKMIMKGIDIHKSLMSKTDAELAHGFSLYQGGVVPGNELRVVNIEGHDVEACCGTHCDNTNEIGWIKLITTKRIADGIVRLYYVAGERTLEILNRETGVINDLTSMWGIEQKQIVQTAARFFKESKTLKAAYSGEQKKMMNLQIKYLCNVPDVKLGYAISEEENPTLYFSFLNPHAGAIKTAGKGIVYLNKKFIYGILSDKGDLDMVKLKEILAEGQEKKVNVLTKDKLGDKKNPVSGVLQFNTIMPVNLDAVVAFLEKGGYTKLDF